MSDYGKCITLQAPYDEAVARTRQALQEQGFGVVTEIDVKKTVKEKLGEDFRPYIILGACMPRVAHQVLSTDPNVGLLMPCNVCVWDNEDGTSTVAAIAVEKMFQFVDNEELAPLASEVDQHLTAALAKLSG